MECLIGSLVLLLVLLLCLLGLSLLLGFLFGLRLLLLCLRCRLLSSNFISLLFLCRLSLGSHLLVLLFFLLLKLHSLIIIESVQETDLREEQEGNVDVVGDGKEEKVVFIQLGNQSIVENMWSVAENEVVPELEWWGERNSVLEYDGLEVILCEE